MVYDLYMFDLLCRGRREREKKSSWFLEVRWLIVKHCSPKTPIFLDLLEGVKRVRVVFQVIFHVQRFEFRCPYGSKSIACRA